MCEQVLNAISLFTSELSFSTYTLDAKVPGPYLDHKKENFGNEKQPNLPYGFHSHLGIPAKDAFTTLYQIPTSLKEALTPQAINLGSNPKERDEIIRKTSNIRRDKIRAKLIGRSLSQLTTMDADNASSTIAQSSKTPETPLTPPPPAAPKFKSVADLFNQQEVIEENDPVNNKTAPNPIAIPNTQPFASKPVVSPKASSSVAKDLVKTRKIVSFVPHPGFVVKTRVTSGVELNLRISDASDTDDPIARKSDVDHGKVFVNICHHPKVDELMQKYGMRRQSLSEGIAPSSSAKPLFMVFGEKNSITDKHGSIATLITVAVGSSYFANSDEATAENPLLITSDEYISMIIGRINTHYRESFDSINFSLPRVKGGYKGDLPTDAKQFSYEAMVETKEEQSPARSSIISDIIHFPKTIADSIAGKNKNKNTPNKKLEVDDDGGIDDSISLRKSLGLADDNIADDISVMSDVTTESVARNMPANRRKTLRSSIFEKMGKLQQTDGQNMITPEMMVIIDDCGITITDSQNLKHYSCERPDVLLGWQIMLHNSHKKKGKICISQD